MIWQFDVPGTQIVTDAKGWLSELLVGPPLTEIDSTLAVGAGVEPGEEPPGALGDVEDSPHFGVDTCAIISRVPRISRRDIVDRVYLTTAGLMPAGTSDRTYATPVDDRVCPDACTIRSLSSIARRPRFFRARRAVVDAC